MTETAKIFMNGGSQAVRLPKTCRFQDKEVLISHIGSIVILMPKDDRLSAMMAGLHMFTRDFMVDGPEDLPVQEREVL